MEAGAAAGQGGGAAAAPGAGEADAQAQQGQQQQDGQQPQQQQDLGPLLQSVADVPAQLEQMREWMEENAQQQQLDPGQDPALAEAQPPDLSFVDPSSPNYDPQAAANQLLTLLQQENSQAIQQAVQPLQEQLQQVQTAREADFLAQEFPELQDAATADAVFKATAEWVEAAGLPREAAGNMQVVRAVYMMGRAAELANQENGQQTPDAASLEGAGGASPGGANGGGLTAESIVGAGGRSVLPF